jgi:GT2 family glycosyltransferase
MRIKKLYGRFSRWYVFGKLHEPGIELPVSGKEFDLGLVRARLSRVLVTTSVIDVSGVVEGQKPPGLHLSVHARAGAATLSAPVRIDWSENPATGSARGVFQATLNVPPSPHGRLNLRLEMPDGTHRQKTIVRYDQDDLARIIGGMDRAFRQFLAREVLPRTLHFALPGPRHKARRAISRTLDTQTFFAAGARHIDIGASFDATQSAQHQATRSAVDIIVPVFNGYDCLARFFARLGSTTRHERAHIWIIHDRSTDERVWPVIQEFAASADFDGRTTVLHNARNLGFPAAVNRGLMKSRHHAVVLNTDVSLPQHWLARLTAPLADVEVASATPFSNRATLASFPEIDRDNDLPFNLDADSIDAVFAEVAPLAWQLDLPTGVGFCLALSRRFLDRIGGFDADTFGRGYGEENDWCQRAAAIGGRNVLVSNLFVEHDHGLSFPSIEKKRLLARNLNVLNRRYPKFHGEVEAYMNADPALPLRAALFAKLACSRAAGGIEIFIDHTLGGGANWYREERLKAQRAAGRPTIVVSGQRKTGNLYVTIEGNGTVMRLALASFHDLDRLIPAGDHIRWVYNCAVGFAESREVPAFLANRINGMANALEIALHDYFPICPSYTLLDAAGRFCGVPADLERCRDCLAINPHRDSATEGVEIDHWRASWGNLLAQAGTIRAFSHNSARLLERAYPATAGRISIAPHAHMEKLRKVASPAPSGPVTIAVIGSIAYAKGGALVKEAARIARTEGLAARIIVIGELSSEFADPAITVCGRYVRTELPDLAEQHGVHMVWFPSIWPETFSYVTEEAMNMGLPIACFDIGAPAERVRNYDHGLVLNGQDTRQALLAMIEHARKVCATRNRTI